MSRSDRDAPGKVGYAVNVGEPGEGVRILGAEEELDLAKPSDKNRKTTPFPSPTPQGGRRQRSAKANATNVEYQSASADLAAIDDEAQEAIVDELNDGFSFVTPELPHWNDEPTGEVPAVLSQLSNDDGAIQGAGPDWREGSEWNTDSIDLTQFEDLIEDNKVGALDSTNSESSMFKFDFDDMTYRDSPSPSGQANVGSAIDNHQLTNSDQLLSVSNRTSQSDESAQDAEEDPKRSSTRRKRTAFTSRRQNRRDVVNDHRKVEELEVKGQDSRTDLDASIDLRDSVFAKTPQREFFDLADPAEDNDEFQNELPSKFGGQLAKATEETNIAPRRTTASGRTRINSDAKSGSGTQDGRDMSEPELVPGGPGRDMTTATIIGVVLAMFGLLTFVLGGPKMVVFVATVIFAMAGVELYDGMRRAGLAPIGVIGLSGIISLTLASYWKGEQAIPMLVLLVLFGSLVWHLAGVSKSRLAGSIGSTLVGVVWIGVPGAYAALMLRWPGRAGMVFMASAIISAVSYDVFGLLTGSRFGKKRIAPHISPNKTVEGLIAGMVASVAIVVLSASRMSPLQDQLSKVFVFALILACVAPLGDLTQSMLKRDLGIKDSGSILPGHGGVFDRFDSVIFMLPTAYFAAQLLDLI